MPYKGFDVNKQQENEEWKAKEIESCLTCIFTEIKYVKDNFSDSDYQEFIKELKENIGE